MTSMSSSRDRNPPPLYSQQDPDTSLGATHSPTANTFLDPQILILPSANSINFQNGYLGAEGERAAIEGEVQIKDIQPGLWSSISISLRTVETAYEHDIELNFAELVLGQLEGTDPYTPSSFPFAIPLMPDTPQSLRTPTSSLTHTLAATLHPRNSQQPPVSKKLNVFSKRYSPHSCILHALPVTHDITEPITVHAQIPRSTFMADESIPIYVTIPSPPRRLLVDQELRLRNVKAELVRVINVKQDIAEESAVSDAEYRMISELEDIPAFSVDNGGPSQVRVSSNVEKVSTSKRASPPVFFGASYKTTIARSGASCRFHSTRPVQLRFVLHPQSPVLPDFQDNLSEPDAQSTDNDAECTSITQSTLLHSVSFQIDVLVSLVDISNHTERISTITIPIVMIPPPAPLPQVDESMSIAYQKKHDRPPTRTIRNEEADYAPQYSEGEAGPSVLPPGAPPPFDEPDAPPPFFASDAEASSSSHPPTFMESETELLLAPSAPANPIWPLIPGEGVHFGFPATEQFDGHADGILRTSTPPPTHEMSSRDINLNELTEELTSHLTLQGTGDGRERSVANGEEPPPPPPAMDDPSDPPPSIDSEFRSPLASRSSPPRQQSPPMRNFSPEGQGLLRTISPPPSLAPISPTNRNAPPPYVVPEINEDRQEHVNRPPPYVDLELHEDP